MNQRKKLYKQVYCCSLLTYNLPYSIQGYGFVGGHCSGGKVYCYNNKQTGEEIYGNFMHSMDPNVAWISDFKFKTDEQQKSFFIKPTVQIL